MKKLLVLLVVAMIALVGCAHKTAEIEADAKSDCASGEKAHECTEACDHSADKAMAKDHVCTPECDHSADKAMAKKHECSEECSAECKAAHMEKHGADHVCTDACKAECAKKAENADCEHSEEAGAEEAHEGGEDKD